MNPASLREICVAAAEAGACVLRDLRDRPRDVRFKGRTDLVEAVVCTGFPYGDRDKLPRMIAAFGKFTELARGSRRLGSAAIDLGWVAAGRLDGFWELGLKPWDVAAGQLLVEEAGGLITRFDGSPHRLAGGEIVAAPPSLHPKMVQVLSASR